MRELRKTLQLIIEYNIPSPVDARILNIFVRALCAYDVLWLRAHPETPPIYESGVRYQTQPAGCEHFKPIPLILRAGNADCDQLAPWRAAELRVRHGIKAMPEVRQMGPALYHVYVRFPDGSVEDVSARLGMPVPRKIVAAGTKILARRRRYGTHDSTSRAAGIGVRWPAQWWRGIKASA